MASSKRNKRFFNWEKDFITLAYPMFTAKEIAKSLSRTEKSVKHLVRQLSLQKAPSVYPGDKFFKLVVLDEFKYVEYKNGKKRKMWNCRCECTNTKFILQASLISGKIKSCGCYLIDKNKTGTDIIPGWLYCRLRRNAELREIPFLITVEELEEIFKQQDYKCALTKIPLIITDGNAKNSCKKCTASVDRKDNSKGYTKENCRILHVNVNEMKTSLSENTFINLCKLIAKNNDCIEDIDLLNNFKKEIRIHSSYKALNKEIQL